MRPHHWLFRPLLAPAALFLWACGGSDLALPSDPPERGGPPPGSPAAGEVERLSFVVPPSDGEENESFAVEVALVDADAHVVPLSGIFIYVDLFPEGADAPVNQRLRGERFENTEEGMATLDLAVEKKGRYRLRVLTDDLPELGPHGPEPYLFSDVFEVE